MKRKGPLLIVLALVAACFAVNSCKKKSQSPIEQLFTGGYWQLASVTATYYTGQQQDSVVALNSDTVCKLQQRFTFLSNKTCTYINYDCLTQSPAAASWSLSPNQLYLSANVVCKDTTAKGSSTPFSYAQIINLGQYSLVLNIGDIQPTYSLTKKRVIYTYGFVRQHTTGSN